MFKSEAEIMSTVLSNQTLDQMKAGVDGVSYDRSAVGIGIVHFGPGAFHRAHQAVYTDNLLRLEGGGDWGICAVSINSSTFRDAVTPQDNLYTLSVLDRQPSQQIIGAIREVLVAPENPRAVVERLRNIQTKAVTLTITEKGYCLTPDGHLDLSNEDIQHDLDQLAKPRSAIGYLVAGLQQRYQDGTPPFVIISCDNLTDNGKRLGRAVSEFAMKIDQNLAHWILENVRFPCTMVDSITPATDEQIKRDVAENLGLWDDWPVQREHFAQWVIEDLPGVELPPWNRVGAVFSSDVRGYEISKLRILNGMHSSLAFVGLIDGLRTVREAIKVDYIRGFIKHILYREIIPTVKPVAGLNLAKYSAEILRRFENPAISHYLSQIAWDSSQKIPFRLLGTIEDNLKAGRDIAGLCLAVAAWMRLMEKMVRENATITDPLAEVFQQFATSDALSDIGRIETFLNLTEIFPQILAANRTFKTSVTQAYLTLQPGSFDSVRVAITNMGA